MGRRMIPDHLHEEINSIGLEIGPVEQFAQDAGLLGEAAGYAVPASESVSQQITRLLGTDDWAILHSGHQLVTDAELDAMEAEGA